MNNKFNVGDKLWITHAMEYRGVQIVGVYQIKSGFLYDIIIPFNGHITFLKRLFGNCYHYSITEEELIKRII